MFALHKGETVTVINIVYERKDAELKIDGVKIKSGERNSQTGWVIKTYNLRSLGQITQSEETNTQGH